MSGTVPLYAAHAGDGYPLVILHGLFGSSENWRSLTRTWSACFEVWALDLRNHGRSPHNPEFNLSVMAGDVLAWLDARGISSAYLLGHSLGGKVAMQVALTAPERVDKLVVVDMAPRAYPPCHDEIWSALRAVNPARFRTRKEIDAALAKLLPDEALRQFLSKNITRSADGTLTWQMDLDAIYANAAEIGAAVRHDRRYLKPSLFVRGARSDYIAEDDMELVRALFPFARLVTIANAGHWVHAEARRPFARLVATFLGRVA